MLSYSSDIIHKWLNLPGDMAFQDILAEPYMQSLTERILKDIGLKRVAQLSLIKNVYIVLEQAHKILFLHGHIYGQMNVPLEFPDMEVMALFPLRILEIIADIQRKFVDIALGNGVYYVEEVIHDLKVCIVIVL